MDADMSEHLVDSDAATSGLAINIHPLAILNITDHYTRSRFTGQDSNPSHKLIGALLGAQSGRQISITNSFELTHSVVDGALTVDQGFLTLRREQFSEVFPTQSIVGWYTIGAAPTIQDVAVHAQMTAANDPSPTVFVLFNPEIPDGAQNLPFTVYESALGADGEDRVDKEAKFVSLPLGIETGEAERIAVEGVTKEASGEHDQTGQVASLTMQRNAISMLYERVSVLAKYVSAVIDGKAPVDHDVLRQIASVAATLPVMNADHFKAELQTEYNDTQLTTYLTTVLSQLEALVEYSDKHFTLYPPELEETPGQGSRKEYRGGPGGLAFQPFRRRGGRR